MGADKDLKKEVSKLKDKVVTVERRVDKNQEQLAATKAAVHLLTSEVKELKDAAPTKPTEDTPEGK
jgi:peptidoglycan hydrolase CwlO-like protein